MISYEINLVCEMLCPMNKSVLDSGPAALCEGIITSEPQENSSPAAIIAEAMGQGWHVRGDKAWCPACWAELQKAAA